MNQNGIPFENSFTKNMNLSADQDGILSDRLYNLVLGGAILWGLLLCWFFTRTCAPAVIRFLYADDSPGALIVGWIGYFVLCLCGSRLCRSEKPVLCFLGYNLIAVPVGLLASASIALYTGILGLSAVLQTVMLTGAIVTLMMLAAALKPEWFMTIGRSLGTTLLISLIAETVCWLFFRRSFQVFDFLFAGIFCLYAGFDFARANMVPRTFSNAICAASQLYLDIINILLRLLAIAARSKRRD